MATTSFHIVPFRALYQFTAQRESEVDETVSRQEGDKTITETVKVKKQTPVFFAFKEPSRAEREEADVERAMWWSRFVDRGLMTKALLMKKYEAMNDEAIEADRALRNGKATELGLTEYDLREAMINEKENREKIEALYLKIVTLRSEIIEIEQRQNTMFENTAEAKAREKLIEYLALHLAYTRADESKDWTPFFKGVTTDEKLASFDKMVTDRDPLLAQTRATFEFCALIRASGGDQYTQDQIESFLNAET